MPQSLLLGLGLVLRVRDKVGIRVRMGVTTRVKNLWTKRLWGRTSGTVILIVSMVISIETVAIRIISSNLPWLGNTLQNTRSYVISFITQLPNSCKQNLCP